MKNKKGFTLIEALVAAAIFGFVAISVLSGIAQQKIMSGKNFEKNIAISLIESKMEELLKFPATSLKQKIVDGTIQPVQRDYVVVSKNRVEILTYDPTDQKAHIRRTTTLTLFGNFIDIEVVVDYGRRGNDFYFQVSLDARRGG